MLVLVWISHGSVVVYKAQTDSDFITIKKEVIACTKNYYGDSLTNWLENCFTPCKLKSWVDQNTGGGSNFKYFEFVEVR
jgi:hypothetical protein